jgi:uncharacterized SAM-binding protein YcdF (DUF218 family)
VILALVHPKQILWRDTMMQSKRKWINYLVFLITTLGLLWILYIQWMIFSVQHQKPNQSDVGIVLGAALWNDYPSPALQERLDAAYNLYNSGYYSKIIVSGGMDHNGSTIPEAEGMKHYLMAKGIPDDHIFIEDQSRSTYENLLFSKRIMADNDWKSSIVITHEYHGARAWDIAHFIGLYELNIYTIKSKVLWMPWHKARETLAFTKWFLIKWGLPTLW